MAVMAGKGGDWCAFEFVWMHIAYFDGAGGRIVMRTGSAIRED
jgi:hypothetical protein